MKIHHIGYAVKNHDKAEEAFRALGYRIGRRTNDEGRNVAISFASNDGVLIELVSPLMPGSPVDGILSKVGPTAYHICHVTDDIDAMLAELRPHGWRALGEPLAAPAINYARVVFCYHRIVGLMELVELRSAEDGEVL